MREIISAYIAGVEELFELGFFSPAAVQRDFQWRRPQSEQMLKDIIDAMQAMREDSEVAADVRNTDESVRGRELAEAGIEAGVVDDLAESLISGPVDRGKVDGVSLEIADRPEPIDAFFLGAIILYPSEEGGFEIFDGLQRLTTLTILIAVLRDKTSDPDLKARLHGLIADEATGRFRLSHPGGEQILPTMVQPPGEAGKVRYESSRPDWAAGQRIYEVARQMRLSFSVKDQAYISEVANFLLEHVRFSVVFICNRRLARQTFVATNLYGVPLSRGDIFKGELLALARDGDEVSAVGKVWSRIVDMISRNGRTKNGRDNGAAAAFEQFLMCADLIERRQPQGVDCLGDLIGHLEKRAARGELVEWISGLEKLAEAWVELERVLQEPRNEEILEYHIWTLNFFKWQEWKPLALYWMARHLGNSPADTTQWRFEMLSKRSMALTLLELDQAKRSEMFLEALKHAVRNRRPFDNSTRWLPLNFSTTFRDRIWDALGVAIDDHEVRRSLMLWYEASLWGPGAPLYIRGASVEHILPGRCSPKSQWMRDYPDAQRRYMAHASLGNLAMVDWELQSPLGNCDFGGEGGKKQQMREAGQFEKYRSLGGVEAVDHWLPGIIQARTELAARHIWSKLGFDRGR